MEERRMKEYYAALDSMQDQHERGARRLDDGAYASYLFSFAGVRNMEAANRIVKDWRAKNK